MSASKTIALMLKGLLKVVASGLAIAAIGWGVVTFYPGHDVKEASADVWDLTPFSRTNTQKFASALEQLGHEPPRVYDWNGNDVYFSVRSTRSSLEQVLIEYQQAFVEAGVNEEAYNLVASSDYRQRPATYDDRTLKDTAFKKHTAAQLSGQIVPLALTDKYLTMGGGIIEGEPKTRAEFEDQMLKKSQQRIKDQTRAMEVAIAACGGLHKNVEPEPFLNPNANSLKGADFHNEVETCGEASASEKEGIQSFFMLAKAVSHNKEQFKDCQAFQDFIDKDYTEFATEFPAKMFKGFRSIEAFRDDNGSTTVTATWSDNKFDLDKTVAADSNVVNVEPDKMVPTCPTCTHQYRFASQQDNEPYVTNVYTSRTSPSNLRAHYIDDMTRRGWQRTDGNILLRDVLQHTPLANQSQEFLTFTQGRTQVSMLIEWDSYGNEAKVTTIQSD